LVQLVLQDLLLQLHHWYPASHWFQLYLDFPAVLALLVLLKVPKVPEVRLVHLNPRCLEVPAVRLVQRVLLDQVLQLGQFLPVVLAVLQHRKSLAVPRFPLSRLILVVPLVLLVPLVLTSQDLQLDPVRH